RAQVTRKYDESKTIELATDIFNQSRQKVTAGTARVRVVDQPKPSANGHKPAKTSRAVLGVGGSGGIGQAVCLQLAQDGWDVAVHFRSNEEASQALSRKIAALGRKTMAIGSTLSGEAEAQELFTAATRRLGPIGA